MDHNLKMVIYFPSVLHVSTEGKNGWELASPDAPSFKIAAKSAPPKILGLGVFSSDLAGLESQRTHIFFGDTFSTYYIL